MRTIFEVVYEKRGKRIEVTCFSLEEVQTVLEKNTNPETKYTGVKKCVKL